MADIFEVMRQRIKNMEAELDATSTQLKAVTTSKQELEEQLHTYKEALRETDTMLEAVATQLRT
jgi:septal ring factor EnvC (AmiA/AmiB activator)